MAVTVNMMGGVEAFEKTVANSAGFGSGRWTVWVKFFPREVRNANQ